jgi:hypothetical protein
MVDTHSTLTPAFLALWLVGACGCFNRSPLSPSPVILPDAVTVSVGESQTFTVLNGSVRSFTLESDAGDWKELVRIDALSPAANSIRLIALRPTAGGYVYIRANLGDGHSPLVSAMAIRGRTG